MKAMKITPSIRKAATRAAVRICRDYGMEADSPSDAHEDTTLDHKAVVEITNTIVSELRKVTPQDPCAMGPGVGGSTS